MQWDLGVVLEEYPGKDGVVRAVKLHTTSGPRVRAIQRLHDLEMVRHDPDIPQVHERVLEEELEPVRQSPVVEIEPEVSPDPVKTHRTRRGRVVKAAQKLDL